MLWRVINSAFAGQFVSVSSVHVQVHKYASLFVRVCLHVTYTHKILDNKWDTTYTHMYHVHVHDPVHEERWRLQWTSDVCMSHVYKCPSVSTSETERVRPANTLFWSRDRLYVLQTNYSLQLLVFSVPFIWTSLLSMSPHSVWARFEWGVRKNRLR